MILIEDYMKLTLEERQKHLMLDQPCVERGGSSFDFRGLIAHMLDTTIPHGKPIYLCHACNNSKCGNPQHLYWGTPRENHDDKVRAGRWKNPWDCMKHRPDASEIQSRSGKNGGEATNKVLSADDRSFSKDRKLASEAGHKGAMIKNSRV